MPAVRENYMARLICLLFSAILLLVLLLVLILLLIAQTRDAA